MRAEVSQLPMAAPLDQVGASSIVGGSAAGDMRPPSRFTAFATTWVFSSLGVRAESWPDVWSFVISTMSHGGWLARVSWARVLMRASRAWSQGVLR